MPASTPVAQALADPHALLALWEQALAMPPAARESLLAHDEHLHAPATLGAQRRRLVERLQRRVGARLALKSRCPACGEEAAFDVALPDLLETLDADAPDAGEHRLDHDGWQLRFRLPAPRDLQAPDPDVDAFVQRLLQHCVTEVREHGQPRGLQAVPPPVLEALSERMEALDPAARIAFAVRCPACGHRWPAPFDAGRALWSLMQGDAEQLLLDIDALAQRYGWSEDQILALAPTRRQAYLQLARSD
jgi:hypothetical protein